MFLSNRPTKEVPERSIVGMSNHPFEDETALASVLSNNHSKGPIRSKTRQVAVLKVIVVLALFGVALFAGVAVYVVIHHDDDELFCTSFHANADKLSDALFRNFESKLWAGFTLSVTLTSYAVETNSSFPFVSLPDFALRNTGGVSLVHAARISFSPLVTSRTRAEWDQYATDHQYMLGFNVSIRERTISQGIYSLDGSGQPQNDTTDGPYLPYWQIAPPPKTVEEAGLVMRNQLSEPKLAPELNALLDRRATVADITVSPNEQGDLMPLHTIYTPVIDNKADKNVVGVVGFTSDFVKQFEDALEDKVNLIVVFRNPCASTMSIEVLGPDATFIDNSDKHDSRFDEMVVSLTFEETQTRLQEFFMQNQVYFGDQSLKISQSTSINASLCFPVIDIYPTSGYRDSFDSLWPTLFPVLCALLFCVNLALFLLYDGRVERRQQMVEKNAQSSTAIVDSLFPAGVRDRLLQSQNQQQVHTEDEIEINPHGMLKKIKRMITRSDLTKVHVSDDFPIAELYPNTTVMFADIAGFTAWSSEREPAQVFQLLETIYHTFDIIAQRLAVFKVETIGDCYVAVTGLPVDNKDHAVVMARFAYECLLQMSQMTRDLEVVLGPGTSDLALRIGLHSGSVIGGVLRGEKSRFQLFGDTMNVASRMESLGARNMIQVSEETATLINFAGKEHWLTRRDDAVKAKGKGELITYWLTPKRRSAVACRPTIDDSSDATRNESQVKSTRDDEPQHRAFSSLWENTNTDTLNDVDVGHSKDQRLTDWNTDILMSLLLKLMASRNTGSISRGKPRPLSRSMQRADNDNLLTPFQGTMQNMTPKKSRISKRMSDMIFLGEKKVDPAGHISPRVREQLHSYVGKIAALYRENPFHNFEHASHVALSANKLLKRIISRHEKDGNGSLSESTYGISSDPLLQFVIVFSALVHDVDHTGVPNAQLVKENAPIASKYQNKCVAEQHSVALALEILKEPQFKDLQTCIHPSPDEYERFKELLVNAVLATDICDNELKLNRQMRWTEAFHVEPDPNHTIFRDNPKATIVVEHIIQASDVAHTMQHWHIFRKWNEKLFNEMYDTYLEGRADTDPGLYWYESELGFFDFYIIPLAKKLKECGVFGISSDECLKFALENRLEWERKGKAVTAEMIARRMTSGMKLPLRDLNY